MNTLDSSSNEAIMTGRVWEEFCDILRSAGATVLGSPRAANPFDRAEGFRYLSRLVRGGLEWFLEDSDPRYPRLRPLADLVKLGADNPDNYYQRATISGAHDYRIWGMRGTVRYLGIGAYSGNYGEGTTSGGRAGYLDDSSLEIQPDGSFEVILSCTKQPGNWLRLGPDSSSVIVRQSFLDREHEETAQLQIECLGATWPPPPVTPDQVARGLIQAARWASGCADRFGGWAEGFAQNPNQFQELDEKVSVAAHADPNICFFHGYWILNDDEALVIELEPPECDYWNFQLNNYWMESLDYRYYRVTLNMHTAAYRSDNSVRIVVASQDPGCENWIDTAGHRHGTMGLRWVRAKTHPRPVTRVANVRQLE